MIPDWLTAEVRAEVRRAVVPWRRRELRGHRRGGVLAALSWLRGPGAELVALAVCLAAWPVVALVLLDRLEDALDRWVEDAIDEAAARADPDTLAALADLTEDLVARMRRRLGNLFSVNLQTSCEPGKGGDGGTLEIRRCPTL